MSVARASRRRNALCQKGVSLSPVLQMAVGDIYSKAKELREQFGDEARARALEWAAARFDSALRADPTQLLDLQEASLRSGYSEQHLARMVREGTIPDLRPTGSKGRILIQATDLPIKALTKHVPKTDEHGLASRLMGGREA